MASYLICHFSRGKKPYNIKNGPSIYSLEELSYYIYNNIFDIDESILSDSLFDYIEDELKEANLANKQRKYKQEHMPLFTRIMDLLTKIGYLSGEELLNLKSTMERITICSLPERLKLKGDYYVKNGRYEGAFQCYDEALVKLKSAKLGELFEMKLYYNMAVAKMALFEFESAMKLFKRAFDLSADDKNTNAYLQALYLAKGKKDFLDIAVKQGFSVSKAALVEKLISEAISYKADKSELPDLLDIANSVALAYS